MPVLLQVENLRTHFYTSAGTVRAVDGIWYTVNEGETVGIVGESGCGKSVGAMSILRLIPDPPGKIVSGSIRFQGRDVLALNDECRISSRSTSDSRASPAKSIWSASMRTRRARS